MKVRMNIHISGTRNGARWPEAGGVVDLPDNEGADLCAQGFAEPVVEEPTKAVAPKPTKRSKGKA